MLPIYQSLTSEAKKNYPPTLTQCLAWWPPFCSTPHSAIGLHWMNFSPHFSGSLAIVSATSHNLLCVLYTARFIFPWHNLYTLSHKYTRAAHCLSSSSDKATLLPREKHHSTWAVCSNLCLAKFNPCHNAVFILCFFYKYGTCFQLPSGNCFLSSPENPMHV